MEMLVLNETMENIDFNIYVNRRRVNQQSFKQWTLVDTVVLVMDPVMENIHLLKLNSTVPQLEVTSEPVLRENHHYTVCTSDFDFKKEKFAILESVFSKNVKLFL